MSECTCPDDGRTVDSANRVILMEPGAETRQGAAVVRDRSKVHIFDKTCPKHGYEDVTEKGA